MIELINTIDLNTRIEMCRFCIHYLGFAEIHSFYILIKLFYHGGMVIPNFRTMKKTSFFIVYICRYKTSPPWLPTRNKSWSSPSKSSMTPNGNGIPKMLNFRIKLYCKLGFGKIPIFYAEMIYGFESLKTQN